MMLANKVKASAEKSFVFAHVLRNIELLMRRYIVILLFFSKVSFLFIDDFGQVLKISNFHRELSN